MSDKIWFIYRTPLYAVLYQSLEKRKTQNIKLIFVLDEETSDVTAIGVSVGIPIILIAMAAAIFFLLIKSRKIK